MSEPDEPVSKHKYEILKIWVPTHGVVNVYRKPGRTGEYHVDNGFLIEPPIHRHHLEKIRVLASHGSVITIKRDATVRDLQNKYTVEPASLAVDQSEVWVDG